MRCYANKSSVNFGMNVSPSYCKYETNHTHAFLGARPGWYNTIFSFYPRVNRWRAWCNIARQTWCLKRGSWSLTFICKILGSRTNLHLAIVRMHWNCSESFYSSKLFFFPGSLNALTLCLVETLQVVLQPNRWLYTDNSSKFAPG